MGCVVPQSGTIFEESDDSDTNNSNNTQITATIHKCMNNNNNKIVNSSINTNFNKGPGWLNELGSWIT